MIVCGAEYLIDLRRDAPTREAVAEVVLNLLEIPDVRGRRGEVSIIMR